MIEYSLTMNPEQARTALKAVELLMRLKLNQYEELPFALIDLSRKDFCDRRDLAKFHLKPAFEQLNGWRHDAEWKDDEWYRLYNLYQVLRYMIHEAEHPESVGVDSYPPTRRTDEPLPGYAWKRTEE